jgi:hypothetical protein
MVEVVDEMRAGIAKPVVASLAGDVEVERRRNTCTRHSGLRLLDRNSVAVLGAVSVGTRRGRVCLTANA